MNKRAKKIFVAVVVVFSVMTLNIKAYGITKKLPEKFLIIDDNGISAEPSNGEYYVFIDNMLPGEVYKNNIYLKNLDSRSIYNLYMRVEPVSTNGNINLFDMTKITLQMDGEIIYYGSPSGIGNIDMQNQVSKLGDFIPGEEKKLILEVILDNSVSGQVQGEIEFKWVFSAVRQVKDDIPNTGVNFNKSIYVILVIASSLFLYVSSKKMKEDGE